MGVQKACKMRRHVEPAKGGRTGDAQRSHRLALAPSRASLGRLGGCEDRQHVGVEHLASPGQGQSAGRAVHQPRSEPRLQPREPLGRYSWRNVQLTAGGGEAAGLHDAREQMVVRVQHFQQK